MKNNCKSLTNSDPLASVVTSAGTQFQPPGRRDGSDDAHGTSRDRSPRTPFRGSRKEAIQFSGVATMRQLGLLPRAVNPFKPRSNSARGAYFRHPEWCGCSRMHVTKESFRRQL